MPPFGTVVESGNNAYHTHPDAHGMADKKAIVTWVLAGLGAASFLFAGFAKALGTPVVDQLHETLGTPVLMLRVIGFAEIVLAGLLLWPKTRWYAAELLAGTMLVAAIWHFVVGDAAGSPGSIVNLVLMGTLSWIDRPAWFRDRFF